jgi:hypothetical protein
MLQFSSWDDSKTHVFQEVWWLGCTSANQRHGSTSTLPQALVFPSSQHPGSQMALSGIQGGKSVSEVNKFKDESKNCANKEKNH